MDITALIRAARRWWWLIAAGIVAAGVATYVVATDRSDEYEATSRLLVGPVDADLQELRASGMIARTYADLTISENHLRRAATEAGVPGAVDDLQESVDAFADETTRVLTIRVIRSDPAAAAALAEELVTLVERRAEAAERPMYATDEQPPPGTPLPDPLGDPASMVQRIDVATVTDAPLDQPVGLLTVTGAVIGGVLALTAALLLERAPWRTPPADVDRLLQRRFLGHVQRDDARGRRRRGLVGENSDDRGARTYRLIATKLLHLKAENRLRSLAVFGASGEDGSDLVAANLALSYARDGRTVALADLSGSDDAVRRLGLGDREREVVTVGDSVLELAEVGADPGRVKVLLSEEVRSSHAGDLQSRHLVDLLGEVADLVIVVAPPMLMEYGTLLVAEHADGVVLVTSDEPEHIDDAVDAFDTLARRGVDVLGTLVATSQPDADYPRARTYEDNPPMDALDRPGAASPAGERPPRRG